MEYSFNLNSNLRENVSLEDFKGKKLVLYFYPKDNTSACTTEAIEFSELTDEFEKENAVVVGISRDSVKTHQNFINKHDLKIELLSDPDREINKQYEVLKPKKMYGKDVIGTVRSTFIFDENSNLIKEFRNVKAKGHAKAVLDFIKEMK